jgi:hypothetical protein
MKNSSLFFVLLLVFSLCSCGNRTQSTDSDTNMISSVLEEVNIHLGVCKDDIKIDYEHCKAPVLDNEMIFIPSFDYFQVGNTTFTVDNNAVDQINTWDDSYSTSTGLSVGSTLSDVISKSSNNNLCYYEFDTYNYIKKCYEEALCFYDIDNDIAFVFLADQLTSKQRSAIFNTNSNESDMPFEPELDLLSDSMLKSISTSLRVSWICISDFNNKKTDVEEVDVAPDPVKTVYDQRDTLVHEEENEIKRKKITLEGDLIMEIHEGTDYAERIYKYVETDWMTSIVAFIFLPDKTVDVSPYLVESDYDFIYDTFHNRFMAQQTSYSGRQFAEKFANKRVRITGELYPAIAGWRNVTEVLLGVDKIEVIK